MLSENCFSISNSKGFTLLEAMVAMVILATTGMALFNWVNASLGSMTRAMDHDKKQRAMEIALEYIEGVNPMENQNGEFIIGPYKITWAASLVEPERQGKGYPGGTSPFRLGLYTTHIIVLEDQKTGEYSNITDFHLRQVGYSRKF